MLQQEWFCCKLTKEQKRFQIDLKVLSMKFKRDFCSKIAQFFSRFLLEKLAAMFCGNGSVLWQQIFITFFTTSSHGDSS